MNVVPISEHNGDGGRYIMLMPTGEVKWGYYDRCRGWFDRNNLALSEPEFIQHIETESEKEEREQPEPIYIWSLAPSRYKYFAVGRSGKGKFFTHEPQRLANGEWFATVRFDSKEITVDPDKLIYVDPYYKDDYTRFHRR